MLTPIFFIKFIVAVSSVVILSDLFERMNPKVASVLSGYPVGVALSLFFFGLENGAEFASQSALFNIVGIVTFLAFITIYYAVAKRVSKFSLVVSTVVATIGFLAIAYVLQQIAFGILASVTIAMASILFLAVPFSKIREIQTGASVKVTFRSVLIKALVAGSIITLVTTLASVVGPAWAGLLASFPATTLPLMLMVHRKYGAMHLGALLKYIPISSISIVFYVLAVWHFYPINGIYVGTLISYAVATVPILLLFAIESSNIIKRLSEALHMTDKSTIHFITTGGTIDFHYERRQDTVVPNKESAIPDFLSTLDYLDTTFTNLFIKDSRNLTNSDFERILKTIEKSPYNKIVVTTGTFRIDKLAEYIEKGLGHNNKTIILTGSTTPIVGFTPSEGLFNLGHAVANAQNLSGGIYISFNGELFDRQAIDRLNREGGLAAIFQVGVDTPVV